MGRWAKLYIYTTRSLFALMGLIVLWIERKIALIVADGLARDFRHHHVSLHASPINNCLFFLPFFFYTKLKIVSFLLFFVVFFTTSDRTLTRTTILVQFRTPAGLYVVVAGCVYIVGLDGNAFVSLYVKHLIFIFTHARIREAARGCFTCTVQKGFIGARAD